MIIDKKLDMGKVTTATTAEVFSEVLDFGVAADGSMGKTDAFGNAITEEIFFNDCSFLAIEYGGCSTASTYTVTLKFYTDATDGKTTEVYSKTFTLSNLTAGDFLFNGTLPFPLKQKCSYSLTASNAAADVVAIGSIGNRGTSS